jgi:hypothetical protein
LEHDAGGVSPRTIDAVVAITNAAASRGVAPEVRVDDLDGLPDDVANAADLDDRAHDIAAQATAGWKPALLG